MATEPRTLPGLGLTGFWPLGAGEWKDANDINLRTLSILAAPFANSMSTALPGSPTNGDIYIVPTGGANASQIAAYDDGAWVYIVPQEGSVKYVLDLAKHYTFKAGAWVDMALAGAVGPKGDKGDKGETGAQGPAGVAAPRTIRVAPSNSEGLIDGDDKAYVRLTSGSAVNFNVLTNAALAIAIGSVVEIRQGGAGKVTFVPASGVTINTSETLKTRKQGSTVSLIKIGTDIWDLTGDLEAAP